MIRNKSSQDIKQFQACISIEHKQYHTCCWKERGYCQGSRQGSSRDRRESRRQKTKEEAAAKQHNSSRTGYAVDRPGRPTCTMCTSWSSVDRLEAPNSLLGTRSTARSTGRRGRSTARSTDKRVRAASAGSEICVFKGCC